MISLMCLVVSQACHSAPGVQAISVQRPHSVSRSLFSLRMSLQIVPVRLSCFFVKVLKALLYRVSTKGREGNHQQGSKAQCREEFK